jgi:hypothetical protein
MGGIETPATTHSRNPDYYGYELCEECAAEYDSRAPTQYNSLKQVIKRRLKQND